MSRPPEPVEMEAQGATIASRLNWLRAGVLGANDGIVSTAGMIFGVAGAAVGEQTSAHCRRCGGGCRRPLDGGWRICLRLDAER